MDLENNPRSRAVHALPSQWASFGVKNNKPRRGLLRHLNIISSIKMTFTVHEEITGKVDTDINIRTLCIYLFYRYKIQSCQIAQRRSGYQHQDFKTQPCDIKTLGSARTLWALYCLGISKRRDKNKILKTIPMRSKEVLTVLTKNYYHYGLFLSA